MAMAKGPLRWILTAFNLRTGLWIFNPVKETGLNRLLSRFKIVTPWYVFREYCRKTEAQTALGGTRSESEDKWVVGAAADGGFYEYLGLDELLRRNCKLVIVSDASTNKKGEEFDVLGEAIRMARHDGIEILDLDEDKPLAIDRLAANDDGISQQHFIMGRILYTDGSYGILVYVQMRVTNHETTDIREHNASHSSFPNDEIANQFFDRQTVESYRALGWQTGAALCRQMTGGPIDYETLRSEHSTHDLVRQLIQAYRFECSYNDKSIQGEQYVHNSLDKLNDELLNLRTVVEEALLDYERNPTVRQNTQREFSSWLEEEV